MLVRGEIAILQKPRSDTLSISCLHSDWHSWCYLVFHLLNLCCSHLGIENVLCAWLRWGFLTGVMENMSHCAIILNKYIWLVVSIKKHWRKMITRQYTKRQYAECCQSTVEQLPFSKQLACRTPLNDLNSFAFPCWMKRRYCMGGTQNWPWAKPETRPEEQEGRATASPELSGLEANSCPGHEWWRRMG